MATMNYGLLECRKGAEEATTEKGWTRKGYAHVHFPSPASGGDEHRYYDLRGLSSHHQKFRNWCKREFPNRKFAIYFGGVNT